MTKNTGAMRGFLGALVLLVGSLTAFFAILFVVLDRPQAVEPLSQQLDDILSESKRQAMRSSQWSAAPGYLAKGELSQEIVIKLPPKRNENQQNVALDQIPNAPYEAGEPFDDDITRAINLIDSGNISEAVAVLDDLLKRDPKNEQALVELAMINLLDLKQPEKALGYLQKVVEVNPRNQIVMSELVSLFEEQGRMDEGINFMSDIFAKNPESTELAFGIGQMLSLQGRDGEAIQYLEKASASAENVVRANRELGEAFARTGDSERAVEAFNRAIADQERDIVEKSGRGLPTQFAEESMNYTKMDKIRELIKLGQLDDAQNAIYEINKTMAGDQSVTALQETLNKRRNKG